MKKVIRLTESDLARIVKRVLMEQEIPTEVPGLPEPVAKCLGDAAATVSTIPGCTQVTIDIMSGKTPNADNLADCTKGCFNKSFTLFAQLTQCATKFIGQTIPQPEIKSY